MIERDKRTACTHAWMPSIASAKPARNFIAKIPITSVSYLASVASVGAACDLAVMFRNFETITRDVANPPNGIRTVTRSSADEVMDQLVIHVLGMVRRVENLDGPEIIIQSRTLDILSERGDGIVTEIELTNGGIVVIQTSQDPYLVVASQKTCGRCHRYGRAWHGSDS